MIFVHVYLKMCAVTAPWSVALDLFVNLLLLLVAANICELNLARSFKYGGRKYSPSSHELFMLMVRLKHCIYLIILFRVFQANILQKYQTKPKDFHVFFQYLTEV